MLPMTNPESGRCAPEAGRDLDALVAEKVMGLEFREWRPWCAPEGWFPKDAPPCVERDHREYAVNPEGYKADLPHYSSLIEDAWEVVKKLVEHHDLSVEIRENHAQHYCKVWKNVQGNCSEVAVECADTAPHAICLAALAVVST